MPKAGLGDEEVAAHRVGRNPGRVRDPAGHRPDDDARRLVDLEDLAATLLGEIEVLPILTEGQPRTGGNRSWATEDPVGAHLSGRARNPTARPELVQDAGCVVHHEQVAGVVKGEPYRPQATHGVKPGRERGRDESAR